METEQLYENAVALLRQMIQTPSFSKEEAGTAGLLAEFLQDAAWKCTGKRITSGRSTATTTRPNRPLLNSHHDTVKPNGAYTRDPFAATVEGDRLYGLGSNDAGASGVSLLAAFLHFTTGKT